MKYPSHHSEFASLLCGAAFMLSIVVASPLVFAESNSRQVRYPSPQVAVEALIAAVRSGDVKMIVDVLGPEGRELASSGDPVADKAARERFTTAYDEAHELKQGDTRATLVIGKDDFPFPIPLVATKWLVALRHGRRRRGNSRPPHRRERDFRHRGAARSRGRPARIRRGRSRRQRRAVRASPSEQRWHVRRALLARREEGEPESPLGPLVGYAQAQGYTAHQGRPTPYHGYIFRVLTAQGPDAKGGARDYIVNGRMIGGFALVASPAEYGNSGVMTFIVNHDGDVYQRDLGPNTTRIAAAMRAFDPDASWREVSR